MNIRNWLLKISIPISKIISKIQRPPLLINYKDVEVIKQIIKDGDILLSRVDWEFSNLFIPGFFGHAAIYTHGFVYEAVTSGVRRVPIEEFAFKKDHIEIKRSSLVLRSAIARKEGGLFLQRQINDKYDLSFTWKGNTAWYCSKLVYKYCENVYKNFKSYMPLKKTFGEVTIVPDDFNDNENFYTVFKSRGIK